MTKKPGLRARTKSIQAAMAAAEPKKPLPTDSQRAPEQALKTKVEAAVAPTANISATNSVDAYSLMPTGASDLKILEERAAVIGHRSNEALKELDREEFICFRLGAKELYGIPYSHADEVLLMTEVTPVPGTPGFIAGIINLRGALLSVMDLKFLFKVQTSDELEHPKIIVVSDGGTRFGIIVDEVIGNSQFTPSGLSPPVPSNGTQNLAYVSGIHEGKVTILNMNALFGDSNLVVNHKTA
ncbi:MAG: purine-binding chemotaxis protein CheW [Rhodospirillaceae bacterium]|jgi:purine-binding chemotaxis protein CheW|nr:purine-binding chemotaxis protein CheW [Rhodospirillaceae bacterium]MBT4702822.1 purine-binding chemotaxis protein CheW [Rhodospirillaceae bacterium]MBT5034805.1 purine-binding chemotaxis protein CheW [Rhodospirillaceae bacterium]MBT6362847.1 purine-binding chemotaxis protein CheW [Rhodospirillaceae bacterium]